MLLQKKMWLEYIRNQDYLVFLPSIFFLDARFYAISPSTSDVFAIIKACFWRKLCTKLLRQSRLINKIKQMHVNAFDCKCKCFSLFKCKCHFFQEIIQMHVLSILSHIMKLIYFFAFLESKAVLGTLNYLTNICSDNICCLTNTSHVKVPRLTKLKKIDTTE